MKNNQHMVLSLLNETAPEPGNVKFITWSELFEELAQKPAMPKGVVKKQNLGRHYSVVEGGRPGKVFERLVVRAAASAGPGPMKSPAEIRLKVRRSAIYLNQLDDHSTEYE